MFRQCKEPLRCPVGDERIGDRWIHNEASAYCEDCKATYFYHAEQAVPFKNQKGKVTHATVYCGPGGCICR